MSAVRLGVGSRLIYDGEHAEVVELLERTVLLRTGSGEVIRLPLVSILNGQSPWFCLSTSPGSRPPTRAWRRGRWRRCWTSSATSIGLWCGSGLSTSGRC